MDAPVAVVEDRLYGAAYGEGAGDLRGDMIPP